MGGVSYNWIMLKVVYMVENVWKKGCGVDSQHVFMCCHTSGAKNVFPKILFTKWNHKWHQMKVLLKREELLFEWPNVGFDLQTWKLESHYTCGGLFLSVLLGHSRISWNFKNRVVEPRIQVFFYSHAKHLSQLI